MFLSNLMLYKLTAFVSYMPRCETYTGDSDVH